MATLVQEIAENPAVNAFRRVRHLGGDVCNWQFEPSPGDVIANADRDGYYVIAAMCIVSQSEVRRCYMDISLPERINDYAYFIDEDELRYDYPSRIEGWVWRLQPVLLKNCTRTGH
jgi:hypothetical protein